MLRRGIPSLFMRRAVWPRLLDDAHLLPQRFPGLFDKLASNEDEHWSYESYIRKDVCRTFPQFEMFSSATPRGLQGQESLFRILKAMSFFDKQVGYVQGTAFIAGFFMLHGFDEEQVFWCMVQLLNSKRIGFADCIREGLPRLRLLLFLVDRLFRRELPHLHQHFERVGVIPEMYASSYILTLASNRLPFETLQRLFDAFLLEGWDVIIMLIVALLKHLEKELITLQMDEIIVRLHEASQEIDGDVLMQVIGSLHLSVAEVQRWTREYEHTLGHEEKEAVDKKRKKHEQLLRRVKSESAMSNAQRVAQEEEESNMPEAAQHEGDSTASAHSPATPTSSGSSSSPGTSSAESSQSPHQGGRPITLMQGIGSLFGTIRRRASQLGQGTNGGLGSATGGNKAAAKPASHLAGGTTTATVTVVPDYFSDGGIN